MFIGDFSCKAVMRLVKGGNGLRPWKKRKQLLQAFVRAGDIARGLDQARGPQRSETRILPRSRFAC